MQCIDGILSNPQSTFGAMAVAVFTIYRPPTIAKVKQPEKKKQKVNDASVIM